jgi:ParB-like chromosome segregation protein Spo0J
MPWRDSLDALVSALGAMPTEERVDALNVTRAALHGVSPFRSEPVDCVLWVPAESVAANDYNPNAVAPPEMRLLALSIETDGYTMPIVTHDEAGERRKIVDGFHRVRIGTEHAAVRERVLGYLPVTTIKADRTGRADRIAATIRHNRARGVHGVQAMSGIVMELHRRNWSDEKIGRELGMEPDEVLRLKQITGLAELFADREFSEAWEVS